MEPEGHLVRSPLAQPGGCTKGEPEPVEARPRQVEPVVQVQGEGVERLGGDESAGGVAGREASLAAGCQTRRAGDRFSGGSTGAGSWVNVSNWSIPLRSTGPPGS